MKHFAIALTTALTFLALLLIYEKADVRRLESELAEANALNRRLQDFHLNHELMSNELMVVHIQQRNMSVLVPVHGIKCYPLVYSEGHTDEGELKAIRNAISEYLKDKEKEN